MKYASTGRLRWSSCWRSSCRKREIVMIRMLCTIGLICIAVTFCYAQSPNHRPLPTAAYELYSWQDLKGSWNFCLLFSPSGPMITAEQIFDDRTTHLRGVAEIKRAISALPTGTQIYWPHPPTSGAVSKTKEAERLRFPPLSIIQEVRLYAKKHSIDVHVEWRAVDPFLVPPK